MIPAVSVASTPAEGGSVGSVDIVNGSLDSGAEPLVVEVDALGAVTLDAEEGLLDPRDVAILADAFDALAPVLARARAPRLPPRATWPEVWREVHAERMAIAAEGGARDPEAVADLDLRAMVARGEVCR